MDHFNKIHVIGSNRLHIDACTYLPDILLLVQRLVKSISNSELLFQSLRFFQSMASIIVRFQLSYETQSDIFFYKFYRGIHVHC